MALFFISVVAYSFVGADQEAKQMTGYWVEMNQQAAYEFLKDHNGNEIDLKSGTIKNFHWVLSKGTLQLRAGPQPENAPPDTSKASTDFYFHFAKTPQGEETLVLNYIKVGWKNVLAGNYDSDRVFVRKSR